MKLIPYNSKSKTAITLANELEIDLFNPKKDDIKSDIYLNWGYSGNAFDNSREMIINYPNKVRVASNKLSFFKHILDNSYFDYVNIPEFWMSPNDVPKNTTIVARIKLNSHSGEGIVIVNPGEELPEAPLYVKYIKKIYEFRVHFIFNEIYIQRKARRIDFPDENINWKIRNHDNGFVYVTDLSGIQPDIIRRLHHIGINTKDIMDLQFGAVDVIYNKTFNSLHALEINTAPGLEGSTLRRYVNTFLNENF